MDPGLFGVCLGLFPGMVSVFLQEAEGAHVGPLFSRIQRLALKTCDLGHLLQGNFISSHQPAQPSRGARVGVSREPGNGPGIEAVTLTGYFGKLVHAKDISIYPYGGGEKEYF